MGVTVPVANGPFDKGGTVEEAFDVLSIAEDVLFGCVEFDG